MNAAWAVDFAVIIGYLALIMGIGLYMGRREESLRDFALGGRAIPWWAVLASIIAAETSAGTFLGAPGEGYTTRSYRYIELALGTIVARILVSYIFLAPYYRYNVYSIYEYLTVRFGIGLEERGQRRVSDHAGARLRLSHLCGGDRTWCSPTSSSAAMSSIRRCQADAHRMLLIYVLASVAVVVLTAIYTTLGGIKAVIWTDFIQATIMMGSALIALGHSVLLDSGRLVHHPDGPANVQHPLDLFIATGLDPARHGWPKLKGMFETEYTIFRRPDRRHVHHHVHPRHRSGHGATDVDGARRPPQPAFPDSLRLADVPIGLVFATLGVLLFAYYQQRPDPNGAQSGQ